MGQIIETPIRPTSDMRALLSDAGEELTMVRNGDYGSLAAGKYADLYQRYLGGIIRTLHWALGDEPSPIFAVTSFDDHLIFREKAAAWAIIDHDPGALSGYDGEFATAAFRTLAWLHNRGNVHPMEFV